MVRPPPGVSAGSTGTSIAAQNPSTIASPRPAPAPVARSPSRWNGWNIAVPQGRRDARAVVRHAQLDTTARAPARRPPPGARPGCGGPRCPAGSPPRARAARVDAHQREVVGDPHPAPRPTAGRSPRARRPRRPPRRRARRRDRTDLDPRHVQDVGDEVVEPVGGLLDRREQLRPLVRRPLDVVLAQARDRGLERASAGCAGRGRPRRAAPSGPGPPRRAGRPSVARCWVSQARAAAAARRSRTDRSSANSSGPASTKDSSALAGTRMAPVSTGGPTRSDHRLARAVRPRTSAADVMPNVERTRSSTSGRCRRVDRPGGDVGERGPPRSGCGWPGSGHAPRARPRR